MWIRKRKSGSDPSGKKDEKMDNNCPNFIFITGKEELAKSI
jgi:hypothetical protein